MAMSAACNTITSVAQPDIALRPPRATTMFVICATSSTEETALRFRLGDGVSGTPTQAVGGHSKAPREFPVGAGSGTRAAGEPLFQAA